MRGFARSAWTQLGAFGSFILTCLLITCSLTLGVANPAKADEDPTRITITQVSPTALNATGELVVAGTITNISPSAIDDVIVQLWRDATPLTTEEALERASGNVGGALSQARFAKAALGDLAPGQGKEFRVRASLDPKNADDQLWLEQPGAAYRVGVEAFSGRARQRTAIGAARFAMAHPAAEQSAQVAQIIEIAARPSRLLLSSSANPQFADDSLVRELTGRLNNLLSMAESNQSAIVVDPALFDDVSALASGNATIKGTPTTPQQAEIARNFLTRLERLLAFPDRSYRGLYGSPDIASAALSGQLANLKPTASLPTTHRLASLPLLIAPKDGLIQSQQIEQLANWQPQLIAVSAMQGGPTLQTMTLSNGSSQKVVRVHSRSDDAVGEAQLAAELLVAGLTKRPVAVLIDEAHQGSTIQFQTQPVALSELLANAQPQEAQFVDVVLQQQSERAALAERAAGQAQLWAELTGRRQTDLLTGQLTGSLWSKYWPSQAICDQWADQALGSAAAAAEGGLRLRVSNSVTTGSDDNLLPVTIVSTLTEPVQVRVGFESTNPQRISIADSEIVEVRPGESATVRVRPHSKANGPVTITAQLQTPNGTGFGETAEFSVQATQAGRVGWIIIVVSGVVLLAATAWRVRQVRS